MLGASTYFIAAKLELDIGVNKAMGDHTHAHTDRYTYAEKVVDQ